MITMARSMGTYRIDYASMTAAQIASHIDMMRAAGKTPSGDAPKALREARARESASEAPAEATSTGLAAQIADDPRFADPKSGCLTRSQLSMARTWQGWRSYRQPSR